jgi:hypothetical protein
MEDETNCSLQVLEPPGRIDLDVLSRRDIVTDEIKFLS